MEKIIYYSSSNCTLVPSFVAGKIVVTDNPETISALYRAGAKHVFHGQDAELEVQKFIQKKDTESFFDHFHTTHEEFSWSLRSVLEGNDLPLLLLGESGVGKTHLAKMIHGHFSPRGPFVAKNLCELSPQLVESELFGHVKGAFTGALNDKQGLLEKADKGTLFLDEIGALPLATQKKLLKVIDEGIVTPVGSTKERKVSFHLITATCDDLRGLIEKKEFREDFAFRISGDVLTIPPLRDRPEDIKMLLKTFQKDYTRQLYFSKDALAELLKRPWKGNIRELNYLYKKLQRGDDSYIQTIPDDSRPSTQKITPSLDYELGEEGLPALISEIENKFFSESMRKNDGRPNRVCQDLKISKSVFYRLQDHLNQKEQERGQPFPLADYSN